MSPANPAQHAARKRVLVIAPHSSYRTTAFLDAARRLGVDILVASEGKYSVVSAYADGLHIDLQDTQKALLLSFYVFRVLSTTDFLSVCRFIL